jgi:hypothetical protein
MGIQLPGGGACPHSAKIKGHLNIAGIFLGLVEQLGNTEWHAVRAQIQDKNH